MLSFPAEQVSQPTGVRLLLAEQLMLLAFQDSGRRAVRHVNGISGALRKHGA